jgi:hypothetical protein
MVVGSRDRSFGWSDNWRIVSGAPCFGCVCCAHGLAVPRKQTKAMHDAAANL